VDVLLTMDNGMDFLLSFAARLDSEDEEELVCR
jgi:hypothetical protein